LIGNRVRSLRKERGLSQEALAFKAGLHHTHIGAVERGETNVSIVSLEMISKGLGVTIGELVNDLSGPEDEVKMKAFIAREIKHCPSAVLKGVFALLKNVRDLEGQPPRRSRRKKA
jgi:transcriptional regulator with XRE-family HTH domain